MEEKKTFYKLVEELYAQDGRYKPDSYEFIMQALHFTQARLHKQGHVTGKELLEGLRDLAIEQYGPMAKTVLFHWGITRTDDIGNIVFNLIDKKILSKTDEDSLQDFKDIYDFSDVFGKVWESNPIKES